MNILTSVLKCPYCRFLTVILLLSCFVISTWNIAYIVLNKFVKKNVNESFIPSKKCMRMTGQLDDRIKVTVLSEVQKSVNRKAVVQIPNAIRSTLINIIATVNKKYKIN